MEDIIMQESAIFKDEITKTLKSGAPVPVPGLFLEMVNCVLWRVGKYWARNFYLSWVA